MRVWVDGALLGWRASLAVRNHSPPGPAWGYDGPGLVRLALVIVQAVTDQAAAERYYQGFKWGWSCGSRRTAGRSIPARSSPGWSWRPDGRCGAHGGGDVSGQRLLGAHLPAVFPERRETVVVGECLGCLTQFAIDARLPLPATCPDCGANVLANADITGEAQAQTAIQSVANPEDETMTLRFHRGSHPAGVDQADRTRRGCGRRTRCGDASVVERKV